MNLTLNSWMDYIRGLSKPRNKLLVVCTSCPGDPLHSGHIASLREGEMLGLRLIEEDSPRILIHVVIVNADSFLIRKKGYYLLPQAERAAVIGAMGCVDVAMIWESPTGSQKVHEALEIIRPDIFYKGGDVKEHNFNQEEREVCDRLGIKLVFGVGGEKTASSSDFFADAVRRLGDRALNPELLRGKPRV